MRHVFRLLATSFILATLALAAPGSAAENRPASAPTAPELSPMMVEINALLDAERLALADCRLEMDRATDMERRVELMERIHELKTGTELEILRVQLRYAREAGRLDTVQELEEAIEFMTDPRPVPAPEPRPRPDPDRR